MSCSGFSDRQSLNRWVLTFRHFVELMHRAEVQVQHLSDNDLLDLAGSPDNVVYVIHGTHETEVVAPGLSVTVLIDATEYDLHLVQTVTCALVSVDQVSAFYHHLKAC